MNDKDVILRHRDQLQMQVDQLRKALHRMTGEFLTQIQFSPSGNPATFHDCLEQARKALVEETAP